jgi:hypothetical protein
MMNADMFNVIKLSGVVLYVIVRNVVTLNVSIMINAVVNAIISSVVFP